MILKNVLLVQSDFSLDFTPAPPPNKKKEKRKI